MSTRNRRFAQGLYMGGNPKPQTLGKYAVKSSSDGSLGRVWARRISVLAGALGGGETLNPKP